MYLYSVFQPAGFGENAFGQAVFVRQGFNRTAFLLTPVWAILNRLWLMLALWALWFVLIVALEAMFNLDPVAATLVYTLGALAFGFEADWAQEAAAARQGLLLQGLSLGETVGDAERLYFMTHSFVGPWSEPTASPQFKASSSEPPDLLGLFPPREHRL